MRAKINLTTRLWESKIFTLTDDENLQIEITSPTNPSLTYFIKARNGGKFHQKQFIDKVIEIDRKDLTYGILSAKIVAMSSGVIVKEFQLEDLILQEIGNCLKVVPEIELLKSDFEKVKAECEQAKKKVAELETLCENTKELVIRLSGLSQKVGE